MIMNSNKNDSYYELDELEAAMASTSRTPWSDRHPIPGIGVLARSRRA